MKIGIVGNGGIVQTLLQDMAQVEGTEAAAIYVRPASAEKGRRLAEKFGIGAVYTDYEEFLRADFDAAYIGLVNHLHYRYTKQALLAGRHVICEKPFTLTGGEARELADIAKERGLFLWEAFRIGYSSLYASLKEHLKEIGEVKLVLCNYSKTSSRYEAYRKGTILPAFDPAFGGGCLYDINSYNVHWTLGLFGEPEAVRYQANIGYNGIDTSGVVLLSYPGFTAALAGGKDSGSENYGIIQGTEGYLKVEGPINAPRRLTLTKGGEERTLADDKKGAGLSEELEVMRDQWRRGDLEACFRLLEHSVSAAFCLERARKDAGIVFPSV